MKFLATLLVLVALLVVVVVGRSSVKRSKSRSLSRIDIPPVKFLPAFNADAGKDDFFAPIKVDDESDESDERFVVDRTLKKCMLSLHPYRMSFRSWEVIASVTASRHPLSLYIAKLFAGRIHATIKWFLYRIVHDLEFNEFAKKCTEVFRKPDVPQPSFCSKSVYEKLHVLVLSDPAWRKELFDPMLVHVFGYNPKSKKDATVAGAVGNDPEVLLTTFEEGNTRELMTLGFMKETVLAPIFMYALQRENARNLLLKQKKEDEVENPEENVEEQALGFKFDFQSIQKALDVLTVQEDTTLKAPHYRLYVSSNYWVYRNNEAGFERDLRKSTAEKGGGVSLGDLDRLSVELSERELEFIGTVLKEQQDLVKSSHPKPVIKLKETEVEKEKEEEDEILPESPKIFRQSSVPTDLLSTIKSLLNRQRSSSDLNLKRSMSVTLDSHSTPDLDLDLGKNIEVDKEVEKELGAEDAALKESEEEASNVLNSFQLLPWHTGAERWQVNRGADYHRAASNGFFTMVAGPSGTTARTLTTARYLGFTHKELYALRLALIGYLVPWQHSLLEVLLGAAEFLPETSLDPVPDMEELHKSVRVIRDIVPNEDVVPGFLSYEEDNEEKVLKPDDWLEQLQSTYDGLQANIIHGMQLSNKELAPAEKNIFALLFDTTGPKLTPKIDDASDWNGISPIELLVAQPRLELPDTLTREGLYPTVAFCMTNIQRYKNLCDMSESSVEVTEELLQSRCPADKCEMVMDEKLRTRYTNWLESNANPNLKKNPTIELKGLRCHYKNFSSGAWLKLVQETFAQWNEVDYVMPLQMHLMSEGNLEVSEIPGVTTAKTFTPRFGLFGRQK